MVSQAVCLLIGKNLSNIDHRKKSKQWPELKVLTLKSKLWIQNLESGCFEDKLQSIGFRNQQTLWTWRLDNEEPLFNFRVACCRGYLGKCCERSIEKVSGQRACTQLFHFWIQTHWDDCSWSRWKTASSKAVADSKCCIVLNREAHFDQWQQSFLVGNFWHVFLHDLDWFNDWIQSCG